MLPSSLYIANIHNVRAVSHLSLAVLSAQYPFLDLLTLHTFKDENQLMQIHAQMITTGLIHNPPAASKLVASFASIPHPGTMRTARSIADLVQGLDTYSWNTIIRSNLEAKNPKEAILVYAPMRREGLEADSYTLLFVVKACELIHGLLEGGQTHGQIFKLGFISHMIIRTALMSMYGLFEMFSSMQKMFDESPQRDTAQWNALIATYAQRNCPHKALMVTIDMMNKNWRPNEMTAVSILSACSCLRALNEGKIVHGYVIRNLVSIDVFVYNALIDMYSKCEQLTNAHRLFQMMPAKNVVSWTSMICGYSINGYPREAMALFEEMESGNVLPDDVTLLSVISACSKLGCFELADWIDNFVQKNFLGKESIAIENALMDMHAKCSNIKKACQIFDRLEEKTLVSWTTMIQGLAMHGHGASALVRFIQMQREGFSPDRIVFFSILSACSHSGLVDEGRKCFQSMTEDYSMTPTMEHYGCMVDLLCRAGLVNEAFDFVENMPMIPDIIAWRMLLRACQDQGNISLASQVVDKLLELEPKYGGNYILLSNVYATLGEWSNVKKVRIEMGAKGVTKQYPGCSLIEVKT